jgi:hypothetical protein
MVCLFQVDAVLGGCYFVLLFRCLPYGVPLQVDAGSGCGAGGAADGGAALPARIAQASPRF